MLTAAGYEVMDLDVDVPPKDLVKKCFRERVKVMAMLAIVMRRLML